jgi:MFS family permease
MALAITLFIGGTVSTYVLTSYMTTFALRTLHLPPSVALGTTIVTGLVSFIASLIGGLLADRFGRRMTIIVPRALLIGLAYPAYLLLADAPGPLLFWIAIVTLPALSSISTAVTIVFVSECLPRSLRATGLGLAYATGVSIFGGSAQFIVTWLIGVTGDPTSPAWFLIVANLVSLTIPWFLKETDAAGSPAALATA